MKSRDREASNRFVIAHHTAIYRFLRQLTRHTQEAEDLTQATLIRAIARIETYGGYSSLRSWTLGIAFREFTRWRRRRLWLPILGECPAKGDPYGDLANAEALLDAIARLSDGARAAFLLYHVEELPVAEVATTLQIPEGTVKSRLHDARARLRTILEEEEIYAFEVS